MIMIPWFKFTAYTPDLCMSYVFLNESQKEILTSNFLININYLLKAIKFKGL